MTDPNTDNSILNKQVTFIQHHLPGLDAGNYKLKVEQTVKDSEGNPINEDNLSNDYKFAVAGDRFRLKIPDNILFSKFPENESSGKYTQVLPHVVFLKKTFPWIRYPNNKEPAYRQDLAPGVAVDADVPTWLGILVLDEDDIDTDKWPGFSLTPKDATVMDLFPQSVQSKSSLTSDGFSYFSDGGDLDYGETLKDQIQVIDVPFPVFWEVAPALKDLYYLAHGRKVSLINKPTIAGVSDVGDPVGDFSIVFGNRLPQTNKKTFAFLISLEELEDYLPDEQGNPGKTGTKDQYIRLAILKNWNFYSTGQSSTFTDSVLSLNGRTPDDTHDATLTNLVLPYSGSNELVKNALSMGFVPLSQDMRTGGKTVSWYRGPLTPYQVAERSIDFPIDSPDQATIFDPTTGMLNVSYAMAWTLGRLLSLQDAGFSTALYKWKQQHTSMLHKQIEDGMIQMNFSQVLKMGSQLKGLQAHDNPSAHVQLYHKTVQLLLDNLPDKK